MQKPKERECLKTSTNLVILLIFSHSTVFAHRAKMTEFVAQLPRNVLVLLDLMGNGVRTVYRN